MFGFTEDMTEKQELVRKFCEEWIYPNLAEIDAGTCCPDYIWEEWCKIPGFASPCAPKFTGGEEMPFATCCAMWEEFGKADVGVAGMTVTPDREKNVLFSDGYATSTQVIIVRKK